MIAHRMSQSNINTFEEALVYKRAVLACVSLIAILLVLYTYAIGSTVHLILSRTSYQKQAQNLEGHIATLQERYISSSQSITLSRADSLGLHETKHVSFVNQALPTVSELLQSNEHEL